MAFIVSQSYDNDIELHVEDYIEKGEMACA